MDTNTATAATQEQEQGRNAPTNPDASQGSGIGAAAPTGSDLTNTAADVAQAEEVIKIDLEELGKDFREGYEHAEPEVKQALDEFKAKTHELMDSIKRSTNQAQTHTLVEELRELFHTLFGKRQ